MAEQESCQWRRGEGKPCLIEFCMEVPQATTGQKEVASERWNNSKCQRKCTESLLGIRNKELSRRKRVSYEVLYQDSEGWAKLTELAWQLHSD